MRIALLNNTNNILFCLTRYLRDRGHDATLLMMDDEQTEHPHFDPSCDTFDLDYQRYTRRLEWGRMDSFASQDAKVVARLGASWEGYGSLGLSSSEARGLGVSVAAGARGRSAGCVLPWTCLSVWIAT